MRLGSESGRIQLIFVTINQTYFALVIYRMGHQVKRSRCQLVFTSKGENKFAFGESHGVIQGVGDFSPLAPTANLDPTIALRSTG